ncbi:hypothetical protein ENBRE01_3313, partial [Enteropsectra breve]
QENYPDGFVLGELPDKFYSKELEVVGIIYTDINMRDGKLFSYKIEKDAAVGAMELSLLYAVERHYKNREMVGICVGPDRELNIGLECFMITRQCTALMDANALQVTTEYGQFCTDRDITYQIKNEYEKSETKRAEGVVLVDYFILQCEAGYKENPMLSNDSIKKCNARKLGVYFNGEFHMEKFRSLDIIENTKKVLESEGKLTGVERFVGEIFSAAVTRDGQRFGQLQKTEGFDELRKLCGEGKGKEWSCGACTLINRAENSSCEACGAVKIEN